MADNKQLILDALRYEMLSSRDIAKRTGISQPTVSRVLKTLPVLKLGGGRSTVFALLTQPEALPLYQVDEGGKLLLLGSLYRRLDGASVLVYADGYQAYDSLPFYLYDVLPAGFLGAITLKKIIQIDSSLNTRSDSWSHAQVVHYLTHYGADLTGNLVLGNQMAERVSELNFAQISRIDYSQITAQIKASPQVFGSSIAGEQPKFTVYNDAHHLIVKYSPLLSEKNPVAQRHRDLLICEHLALESLREAGIPAAKSSLFMDDRVYLEIARFDRIGEFGRKGMVSLRALDAEYVGKNSNWVEIAQSLLSQKIISQQSFEQVEIAYAFGQLIANTDMHLGNFSFYMDGINIGEATPIYDMLPMAYMPRQGELMNPEWQTPRFIPVSENARNIAQEIAERFWESVGKQSDISDEFKELVC
ncbi:HipA domain-containing protein [Thiomicrorhabdus sp. 6S2-11]|uniref:HipA domain-containing protein n=1 Tax=Thiomicrorhabdus marina TaxID=2818442 RepID=A0ABS3Q4L0_9GAMM|nr:HipA domain-containing protein [Thiomicrorhabdus marina]